jgi:hypothetical protein
VADAQRFHDVLTDPTFGRFRPENVSRTGNLPASL